MQSRNIKLIIIITSLSLIGIVFTQLFWVRNAINLKEEQFNHRVRIALKNVVGNLVTCQSSKFEDVVMPTAECGKSCQKKCEVNDGKFLDVIKPKVLDSLIIDEFKSLAIGTDYEYGIFQSKTKAFVMGNNSKYEEKILKSDHTISLSCLWKPDSYMLGIYFPDEKSMVIKQMIIWLIFSAFFLIIVVSTFSYTILSFIKQKKLSEIKTDFVNNMTHEFKTPISTISLASEMLMKPNVFESQEKLLKYANIIYDENNRLKNQVDQVLQIAVLDKGNFSMKQSNFDAHEIINNCIENITMVVKQRGGEVNLNLKASESTIYADVAHFTNIISNLLDNANKYSPDSPNILVSSESNSKELLISIEDKGIGISSEHQKDIFKQFYRVPTGNIHDVKGFGLGLFYVKTIVDAFGGNIKVKSELKKGTTFILTFPIIQKNNEV